MRIGIVINPISGRTGRRPGEAARRRAFAESRALVAGVDASVVMTERQGHARELAAAFAANGCETVLAMGGDGTVNEVAQALVGSTVALGILPCGSGDGLAHGLGLPRNLDEAMRVALSAQTITMDVGYAGDRLFLNVAGIGFDAAVGQLFAARSKRGALGYVIKGLQLVWTYTAPEYEVTWHTGAGEETRTGRKFLVGFANGPEYGNGAVLSPDASVQDGLLDLLLVSAGGPLQQIWRARRLFLWCRRPAHGLERARVLRATVRGQTLVCHVDGEVFETSGSLEFHVRPQALLVRA